MAEDERQFEKVIARLKVPDEPRPEHRRGLWQRMVEVFQQALRRYEQAGPLRRRWMTASAPGHFLHGRGRKAVAGIVVALAVAALAVHLTVGLVAGWASLHAWLGGALPAAPPVAWTDVLERLRGARTVRFEMTIEPPGGATQTVRVAVLRPGRLRLTGSSWVQVIDRQYGKVLTLYPSDKTYRLILLIHQRPELRIADVMEELASLDALSGRRSDGPAEAVDVPFEAAKGDLQWTIRADPRTGEPVYIRRLSSLDGTVITLTDFAWQPALEEADFLLSPPAGYVDLDKP